MQTSDNNNSGASGGSSFLYEFGTTPNTRTAVSQKVRLMTPHYGNAQTMQQMGVISTFNPTQNKQIDEVRGIGFGDKIAELVPGNTAAMSASCERALMYLCNLWQGTGYAGGVDGPVRSLAHHKWPFDLEQQLVFSSLADMDMPGQNSGGAANQGYTGNSGNFDGGIKTISYPSTTSDPAGNNSDSAFRGHSAIITLFETCWWNDWSSTISKDQGVIMENGTMMITDVHDFSSVYGEFLATGNDPTIGQLGSIRFGSVPFANTFAGLEGQGLHLQQ